MRRFLFNVNHINVWLDIPSKTKPNRTNKHTPAGERRCKRFFALKKDLIIAQAQRVRLMSDKLDKHNMDLLKEMVNERKPHEPVEEVLATFCERQ